MPRPSQHILSLLFVVSFNIACVQSEPSYTLQPPTSTTTSAIAIANLNSKIEGIERALARTGNLALGEELVTALLMRAQYLGSFSDFERAQEIAEGLVNATSLPRAGALLARANVRSAVHEFESARVDYEEAAALGAQEIEQRLSTLSLALGEDLESVLAQRLEALESRRDFRRLSDAATALAALGHFEEADAYFVEALDVYRDVSPFPVAFIYFQRGVMWAEQADRPEIARPLYEQAVAVLPEYVVANVHLAELEALDGDLELAIARMESLYLKTEDPEPTGYLAELIQERDPLAAAALIEEASEMYGALFAFHPLAFLDHGSEFFVGPGNDTARGLELALKNLEARKNARAYIVAIEAALAHGNQVLACELANTAKSAEGRNVNLEHLIESVEENCSSPTP